MKRYLIGFALASGIVGMASAALAQTPPVPAGTVTSQAKKDEKVPYYGLTFDFTAGDGTGLNSVGENYRNDLVFYFEPTWNETPSQIETISPGVPRYKQFQLFKLTCRSTDTLS